MDTAKLARAVLLTAAAAAVAMVSLGAQAQSRCRAPATQADRRACEFASAGRLDDLRRFIQRTQSIYGLYFYDYVKR